MEASALQAPTLGRRPLSFPLLRLRSDEQLVALFRAGNEDAFAAMHERYRQRLFAYVRQMLSAGSRPDAEDVLQDVFVRAYGALRADDRDVNLRAWLYRVAHNRCIDHLRRPTPPAGEVFEMSRTPLQDPIETAQRRDDLKRLVADVGRLPDQQRSALLMREIDGLSYADIAAALEVTLPAVKSLLVRARIGLVEAAEARDTDCALIRGDLLEAYDRGVKASGRARKHMRECAGCREYRGALRGVRRSFAALSPVVAVGPLALVAKALGAGGASGSAAAGGGAALGGGAVGGGAGIAATGAVTATAAKVAAVVCTAVVATGGAAEVGKLAVEDRREPAAASAAAPGPASTSQGVTNRSSAVSPVTVATIRHRTDRAGILRRPDRTRGDVAPKERRVAATVPALPGDDGVTMPSTGEPADPGTVLDTGGAPAPTDPGDIVRPVTELPTGPTGPPAGGGTDGEGSAPPASGGSATAPGEGPPAAEPEETGGAAPAPRGPAPEH